MEEEEWNPTRPNIDKRVLDGPGRLVVVPLPDREYFIDLLLGQFRNVKNGEEYIPFDTELGRQLCRVANVVSCRHCRANFVVSSWLLKKQIRCMRCGLVVG